MSLNIDAVIALIKEIENQDAIDWGMLDIGEEAATRLLASSVIEHYEQADPAHAWRVVFTNYMPRAIAGPGEGSKA